MTDVDRGQCLDLWRLITPNGELRYKTRAAAEADLLTVPDSYLVHPGVKLYDGVPFRGDWRRGMHPGGRGEGEPC